MRSALKSIAIAFALYVSIGGTLLLFWIAVLGVAMGDVWDRLGAWAEWIGGGAMLFAAVSGLVLYFWALVRSLRSVGIAPTAVKWHALTTGTLPVVITVGVLWLAIANMRLGW